MTNDKLILVVDQGTTSSRAILYTEALVYVFSHSITVQTHTEVDGKVEQDAEQLWQGVDACCRACIAHAAQINSEIVALGVTNQRETVVAWDTQTGEVLAPAIVWQDSRTADECRKLVEQGHEQLVRQQTGLLIDPYFSASKIRWLLDNVASVKQASADKRLAVGTVDSFLMSRLAGKPDLVLTEATNASRTSLFNINTGAWSEELCDLFGVPIDILGEVIASTGKLTDANFDGISIPIMGVAGDQQASLIGHGSIQARRAKCTFGTGAFLLAYTGSQRVDSTNGLLTTLAMRSADGSDSYALEGSCFYAGAVVEWLINQLQIVDSVTALDELIAECDDAEGVVFVPAFVGLGAPWWQPETKASIVNITPSTTKQHIAVAALHGVCLQVRDLIECLAADGVGCDFLHCDGGLVNSQWFCQQLANILQCTIIVPADYQCTAKGAGKLALEALHVNIDKISDQENATVEYKPVWSATQADDYHRQWKELITLQR